MIIHVYSLRCYVTIKGETIPVRDTLQLEGEHDLEKAKEKFKEQNIDCRAVRNQQIDLIMYTKHVKK